MVSPTLPTSAQARTPDIRLQRKDLPIHLHIPIHLRPSLLQRLWRLPSILRVSQPQPYQVPLLLVRVREAVTRVEDAQVVRELHIAFLEIERHRIFLGKEMQRIECFGLGFGNRRDVWGAREALEAGKCAARVLDNETLGGRLGGGLVVQKRTRNVRFGFVAEAGCVSGWN